MRSAMKRSVYAAFSASIVAALTAWIPDGYGADDSGARTGDAAMTCAQIATELQPYMQQMKPSVSGLEQTIGQVQARSKTRMSEATAISAQETAEARAAALDPTGMTSKLLGLRQAQTQKEVWQRAAAEDKPLNDKYKSQVEQVAAQGQQLKSDARLQRLMQLAREKNCQ